MKVKDLLNVFSSFAGDYYKDAVSSIKRNKHMNDLTEEDRGIEEAVLQRIVDAVIVDFINYVGFRYGGDYGMYTKHLSEEFKKNEKARKKKAKHKK